MDEQVTKSAVGHDGRKRINQMVDGFRTMAEASGAEPSEYATALNLALAIHLMTVGEHATGCEFRADDHWAVVKTTLKLEPVEPSKPNLSIVH